MAISFKNVGIKKDNILFDQALNPQPIGIKTPLEINTNGFGPFQAIYDPVKQLKDNLRNLISTNNGERLGRYNYGANLRSLAFDLTSKDDFELMEVLDQAAYFTLFVTFQSHSFQAMLTSGCFIFSTVMLGTQN